MQQAGENISNLLLYKIAKYMKLKILMPSLVHMQNKISISDNLTINEISNEFLQKTQNYSDLNKIYNEKFIHEANSGELKSVFKYSYKIKFNQKIKHYFKRLSNDPENIYQNFGKTRYNMIKDRIKKKIKIIKVEKFIEKYSIKSIEDTKFFYFPLASEPEARILASAPYHSNQIVLIENIAKSIPIDSLLYVKEHPLQKIKYWRNIEDYKKIIALPNVKLVHPDAKSEDLLLKCQGVITISGGTGFEALFHKKPVFLFADEFYDVLSSVTKIDSISKLPKYIHEGLKNFKFDNNEFNIFMESFDKHTISIPYHILIKEGNAISSIQEYDGDFDLTMSVFQKFYQKYKIHFELMAKTNSFKNLTIK